MDGTKAENLDFIDNVDSFVLTAKAYKNLQDDGYVYCPCIDCKNQKQFDNVEQIRFHLLFRGFMPNYQVWNKHGEVDENEPTQVSMHTVQENMHETVEETTIPETVEVTGHESVNETMQETLVADDVGDALDQMIHDGEPDFLDEKNLM
ncbi:transposon protein, putative, CACTA, En/Spm sub-class [Panicum miliaceum]|uniref:Transposon protein, putative, CACTA, En/Spm sub-class n=1 Tax=Panicum miliaceum TaxID=4540 RepID=A0A3L6RCW5_PANMI|nr:transposon protein, putative, CACTA, En/Spm sub-class [Panicum miliaceum]